MSKKCRTMSDAAFMFWERLVVYVGATLRDQLCVVIGNPRKVRERSSPLPVYDCMRSKRTELPVFFLLCILPMTLTPL